MFIDPELSELFGGGTDAAFERAFALQGEVFRNVKNRRTLKFEYRGKNYFIKIHRGVGWQEIFKCLFQFKKPVLGAENEYLAIRRLESLGIPTMTCRAYLSRGEANPAKRESFIVTDELTNVVSLEDFCRDWANNPPEESLKNALIGKLAETCGKMHFSGMNHRDCYLCHFLLDTEAFAENRISLKVLDLHRAEIRRKVPRRMHVKDLAGIFFSSMDLGLTEQDALRFMEQYEKFCPVTEAMWKDVRRAAVKLYQKEQRRARRA